MRIFFIIALVLLAASAKIAWPLEKCGSDSDLVEFTQVLLSAKPSKGTTSEITLVGTAGDHIEFKEVTLTARLNGITVQVYHTPYTAVFDAGDPITYIYNNDIPGFTPNGNYLVTFDFVEKTSGKVGCGGIKFSL